jgi:chromosome segregation ATPase
VSDCEEIEFEEFENNVHYAMRDELKNIVTTANAKIKALTERAIVAEDARAELEKENVLIAKARDEIETAKTLLENEHISDKEELDKLKNQKGREESEAQAIDDRIDELLSGQSGDPGHLYDRDKRVADVIKFTQSERDKIAMANAALTAELAALTAAIVPELERLEGHEKRLQVIVDEFAGKVKGERLSALLREAKDAF